MEKKNENQLRIKFATNAFNKASEDTGLRDCKKYTKHVAKMNKCAEILDRSDKFSELSLLPSDYANIEGEYGIEKRKFHSRDERLLPHQKLATHAFLRELRGFGLLADVVGSGKTYEACAVLSELAAKGEISSLLLIVPSQVYNTWIEVLEKNFGLGIGVLHPMDSQFDDSLFERGNDGLYHPEKPIIVKMEDFEKWRASDVQNLLFDVIVVDEAHHLCVEEGCSANALKLLSIMMLTKKMANKTYCILLSATPHSGNLENMFRLWYFITCKGGDPSDFDEKDDSQRTLGYRKEKDYYKNRICHGATTVMDFIQKVKIEEVTGNFAEVFDMYLAEELGKEREDFDDLLEGEKKNIVQAFLEDGNNAQIKKEVNKNIANAYHNGVLRSIMIRQPNDRIRKSKRIENVFFFPAKNKAEKFTVNGLVKGETIEFYPDKVNDNDAIIARGEKYSVSEYVQEYKANFNYSHAISALFLQNGILSAYGLSQDDFSKANSIRFYADQIRSLNKDDDIGTNFVPVYDDLFTAKMQQLKSLLTKHDKQRVIVFFDYDIDKTQRCFEQVLQALKEDKRFAKRVIIGDAYDKARTEKKFNQQEDTVLVVTDNAFTEGANLQKSNVIVNFQTTPNPIAMEQRIGRIFRLGQENDVTVYSFADMRDLEGYVLMYFTKIGLMTSNSGDAAIIAGSNNDNMVTIRCNACGRVKLMSKDDYEALKKSGKKDEDGIYCKADERCRQRDPDGTMMTEINTNELKCDSCEAVIRRQNTNDGGKYYCLSATNTTGDVLCNKGDRTYYCKKICAISKCSRFTNGDMKGKCAALNYYLKNPNASDLDLAELCDSCDNKLACFKKCRIGNSAESVMACFTCSVSTECSPRPHVIEFNDKWEADCPRCSSNGKHGKLKPIVAKTFDTYIRSSFNYLLDNGNSFVDNLEKETRRVDDIQQILRDDKSGE